MNDLRAVFAIAVFFISVYLVYDIFAHGFDIFILIACIVGFILVHYIWPKSRDDDSPWYESLEVLFDLPYRTIAFSLRALSKIFSNSDILH